MWMHRGRPRNNALPRPRGEGGGFAYPTRVPFVTRGERYGAWLDNETPDRELKAMLVPFPAERMTARAANPVMNQATVEGPVCLEFAAA